MNDIILKKCEADSIDKIEQYYKYVINHTENMHKYTKWVFGQHPTHEMIEGYIKNGFMYTYETTEILGAVAVTPFQGEEYHGMSWQISCPDNEVSVVHLLSVNPDFQKKGIAKQIIHNAVEIAKNNNSKSLRLDALSCNTPAHRLYQSMGFKKIGVCNWFAENVSYADFYLYELVL